MRSRKRSEKWDNNEKNMVEDMDILKRSVLLETINVAARRYMSIINKRGFSDHSVIKLTSFFFGPETTFDDFQSGRIEFMPGRNHSRYGRNASWAKLVMGETRGYLLKSHVVISP